MANRKIWADFIARYYGDASFASEVDKDPAVIMRKHGINIPEGKNVCLHKPDGDTIHITFPPNPSSEARSEEMGDVFGGFSSCLCW